jgi:hypothetical protein
MGYILAILAGLLLFGLTSDQQAGGWARGYVPCATEDSPGPCYWDASTMGNEHGRSFLVMTDGEVFYR